MTTERRVRAVMTEFPVDALANALQDTFGKFGRAKSETERRQTGVEKLLKDAASVILIHFHSAFTNKCGPSRNTSRDGTADSRDVSTNRVELMQNLIHKDNRVNV